MSFKGTTLHLVILENVKHGPVVGLGVGSGAEAIGSLSATDSSTIGVSGGGDEEDGSSVGWAINGLEASAYSDSKSEQETDSVCSYSEVSEFEAEGEIARDLVNYWEEYWCIGAFSLAVESSVDSGGIRRSDMGCEEVGIDDGCVVVGGDVVLG